MFFHNIKIFSLFVLLLFNLQKSSQIYGFFCIYANKNGKIFGISPFLVKNRGFLYYLMQNFTYRRMREDNLFELGCRIAHTHRKRSRGNEFRTRVADTMHT